MLLPKHYAYTPPWRHCPKTWRRALTANRHTLKKLLIVYIYEGTRLAPKVRKPVIAGVKYAVTASRKPCCGQRTAARHGLHQTLSSHRWYSVTHFYSAKIQPFPCKQCIFFTENDTKNTACRIFSVCKQFRHTPPRASQREFGIMIYLSDRV